MPLHKALLRNGFRLPQCEKHFHDTDEAWIILEGRGTGYWIAHDGTREEFELEAGDVWLVPAGYEHGSEGPNSSDFTITVVHGSDPPGAHETGHYYMEQEGYIPSLELRKTPTDRYAKASSHPESPRITADAEEG